MDTAEDAREYNAMDHAEVNARFAKDFFTFVDTVLQDVGELNVLDVGTGTALLPVQICKTAPQARVLAIDDAVSMLELASYNVEAAGLREQITLAKVDAKKMPYDDEAFPFVIANSIHHHIPSPMDCFREMVRVTEEDGVLFVRDLARPDDEAALKFLVQQYAGNETERCQNLFADSLRAGLTRDEVADMVEELGFPSSSVSMTSDRHWTWAAIKEVNQ